MTAMFEEIDINGMKPANRFVRSATWEGLAEDNGAVTPKLLDCMTALAGGGVGLIITSHAYVEKAGQAGPWQLGVYSNDLIPGLAAMVQSVHRKNGKIVLQLAHAGCFANATLAGEAPLAVSLNEGSGNPPRTELTKETIARIANAFGDAAVRAKKAGFDGVQIHAAHGYLLSQFLSPAFNRRTDEYGGPIQNRARALMETLRAVRKAVGPDYPVLVKLNSRDDIENGLTPEDALIVGKMLAENGIDAIELSGGCLIGKRLSPSRTKIDSEEKEAYFRQEAKAMRAQTGVPLILVGGNRSFEMAGRLLSDGTADILSMSRPLIREPGLFNRWKAGDTARAACISCNLCFGPALEGHGIYCVAEKNERDKRSAP